MRYLIFLILLLFSGSNILAQNNNVDNSTSYEVYNTHKDKKDPFLNVRNQPETKSSLVSKLVDGTLVIVLEMNLGKDRMWYKIQVANTGKIGYANSRFLRKTKSAQIKDDKKFIEFFKHFAEKCISDYRLDSLIHSGSPVLEEFIHKKIGIGTSTNPGAFCRGGMFMPDFNRPRDEENYYFLHFNRAPLPNLKNFRYFPNQTPSGGFCDQAKETNGIFFIKTNYLPSWVDEEGQQYISRTIEIPTVYAGNAIIYVAILVDKHILTQMYFIYADSRYWFLFKDDCDCSV